MIYAEIIKAIFKSKPQENFVMYLMRFKGKDYVKFYNIVNPDNIDELKKIAHSLNCQMINTIRKIK